MTMTLNPTRTISVLLAICSMISTLSGERGVLHADGILSIKRAPEGLSRITVMPFDAPAYMLPTGSTRFVLDLELDNTFMVTFEQVGCVTKQLYFDTTVPVDHHAGTFDFPFKVILEDHGEGGDFNYAGPVGFIHYQHGITDFAYETNYTIKVHSSFHERMEVLRGTGVDPKLPKATLFAAMVITTGYHRPEAPTPVVIASTFEGTLAPMVALVPQFVQRIVHGVAVQEVLPIVVKDESLVVAPIALTIVAKVRLLDGEAHAVIAVLPLRSLAMPPVAVASASFAPITVEASAVERALVNSTTGRQEHLIVEPNRVTMVVCILQAEGRATEFRRVTPRNGAVYFFKDGLSVSESMYTEGVALHVE